MCTVFDRYPEAIKARAILEKYGIGLENALNGAWVPGGQHARMHTRRYYDTIFERLSGVRSRQGLIDKLNVIRDDILSARL